MRQHGTVELGVSVEEHELPNDDADQMTMLPPPFHGRDGRDKLLLI